MANPVLTTNLSGRGYLVALDASSAQGLVDLLVQIKIPYRVVSMYSDGKKHFAVIETNRKLKIKGNNNG
jgi:hypothetical protein